MKHTKHLYTLVIAIMLASTAYGQQDQQRYIEVTGSAETEITPDIIKLTLDLREYEKNKRLVSLKEIEAGLFRAIEGSGLSEDQVVVTKAASSAYSTRRKRKAFASKSYEITFSDQKGLLNFTSRLKNTDISYMHISYLGHSKMSEYRLKVKTEAVVAARKKATAMVEAAGASLGHPLTITEYNFGDSPYAPYNAGLSNSMLRVQQDSVGTEADDIGFKKIKLRYQVNTRFAIE